MKKSKILFIVFSLVLTICSISFGVYAAYSISLQSGGTVQFTHNGLGINIDGNIQNALTVSGNTTFSGTTVTANVNANRPMLSEETLWNFGTIEFNSTTAMVPSDAQVTFNLSVTNYSEFVISVLITMTEGSETTNLQTNMQNIMKLSKNATGTGKIIMMPKNLETSINLTKVAFKVVITKDID